MNFSFRGLYLVMTDPVVGYAECARIAASEGVGLIQLRMKHADRDTFLKTGEAVRHAMDGAGGILIVNDDLDVARQVDADGLHVGQDDMDVDAARAEWGKDGKCFGLSTHGQGQDESAQETSADYIGVGPIFTTPTKDIPDSTIGIEQLKIIAARSRKSCVAIGGINEENLPKVLSTGVQCYALVREVCAATDPARVIRRLKTIEKQYGIS